MATSTSQSSSSETALPPLRSGPHTRRLGLVAVIACFGGFLFGYDTGVFNGAEIPMQAELGLTDIGVGVVLSSLIFAAGVGALFGGRTSDLIGRKRMIVILAVLFFVGSLVVVLSPNFAVLVLGRIILGLAVGGASTVVPIYLSELAPFEIRGSIAGRNELFLVIGQLLAFVVNAILGTTLGHLDGVWRLMFLACAVPAVALFVGMLRMPESPRWLVEHGQYDRALAVLKTIRPEDRAIAELGEVKQVADEEKSARRISLREILRNKWLRRILLVGCGVGVAQQLTGISSVMYYGQRVLIESGFEANAALIANLGPGIISVVGAYIALRLMDRIDRRKTFIIGFSLTTICHVLIGTASILLPLGNPARPFVILILVIAFVGSMQTFLNVLTWVYMSEIFPLFMRGLGMGISVLALWVSNGIIQLFFPTVVETVGITGTFFLFAGVGVLALLFVSTQVPESRGVTLEKLESDIVTGSIFVDPTRRRRH